MGYYIDPPDMEKEEFLSAYGRPVKFNEAQITATELPVILVNNGFFTAAAIAFDNAELRAFTDPTDTRPKKLYMVSRERLRPYYANA